MSRGFTLISFYVIPGIALEYTDFFLHNHVHVIQKWILEQIMKEKNNRHNIDHLPISGFIAFWKIGLICLRDI